MFLGLKGQRSSLGLAYSNTAMVRIELYECLLVYFSFILSSMEFVLRYNFDHVLLISTTASAPKVMVYLHVVYRTK